MSKWNVSHDWNVEIWFRIEKDQDGYPESKTWEQLLAWPVVENEEYFCVESIPFFLKGISRGDIVQAKIIEDPEIHSGPIIKFDSIVERGGHHTYRILLRDEDPSEWQSTQNELTSMGLIVEIENGDFFAVDVPPTLDQEKIDDYMVEQANARRWGLQDGYVNEQLRN